MCLIVVHLLVLMTLSCLTRAEDKKTMHVSCPEHQKTYGGSCFEFMGLQRTFYSAEAWCEQRGGHLAFIPNEETQYFIQTHLDPKQDVWIGAAPSYFHSPGPFSWLDNSPVTFSKWEHSPQPGAACGHILTNSRFQWKATKDCDRKLHFICQFESGRSIVCAGRNTTLQCGSGQVLMIDGGFYGRKNMHYCRVGLGLSSLFPLMTPTQQQCTWVDVQETLTAYCQGRQVCQVTELVDSFGEPCPQHGSYMSVDYHCKEGRSLTVGSVYDDVTIRVKWLLDLPQGDINCKLSTGDGHIFDLRVSKGSVVYKYKWPNAFVVMAECTHSDIHITAQKMITIQEPITELGVIRCLFLCVRCTVWIETLQMLLCLFVPFLSSGTNVTYRIQKDEMLLSSLSMVRGNIPQNVTVTSHTVQQLGPGCHHLTLYALNMATFPETSAALQVIQHLSSGPKCFINKGVASDMMELILTHSCYHRIATNNANSENTVPPAGAAATTRIATNSANSENTVPPAGAAATTRIATNSANSENTAITANIATTTFPSATSNTASNTITTMASITATTDDTSSPATSSYNGINCSISPESGTTLDAFTITCHTEMPCSNCQLNSFHAPKLYLQMLSLDKNPFSWNERGNISGLIGTLSLTTTDGSKIPMESLSDDIEVSAPSEKCSILCSPVERMVPSKDPLPFKVLLGYKDYPTETNHVAMTEIVPFCVRSTEEKYTWLLDPVTLKGNTGEHYLVVRPIVGPGIKSIDASLSITPITSSCKFWDESKLDWSNFGCRVGVNSTHLVTQCLCNHLTFFGSSFFVTPNLVDPSRTAELFATFGENPVVVCFVGALFVAYLLAVVWARRKDIQDTVKVTVTVLEDNDPMDEYRYLVSVSTGHRRGASTSSQVAITLVGVEGINEPHHLTDRKKCVFERGAVDMFLLTAPFSLGDLQSIRLWHNNSGSHPAWYVGNVMVQDLQTEQRWHFLCNSWLAIDMGDCFLDKVFPVASEIELKRFSNLFFMKTTKDFSDGHLWYSVISRPPSSTFTCVQRVSCCFSLLLCTMLTSLMFYGIPTDPSEQTLDLGHFEFTWQQFMIGVQSSLIMFPVNILIVSIFRSTRPRETSCCWRKAVKPAALERLSFSQSVPTNQLLVSLVSLKKCTIMHSSCINPPKNCQIYSPIFCTLPEGNAIVHPVSTEEGIQKKSNKSQYLYRQLCHIDRELTLLGPSGFPNPNSYNQALQQVRGMKGSLEDQLFRVSCRSKKKIGLPWWFIFIGWLLVIGTSVVAGYFTMLYGLKFGKERSVSWLVSQIVSFFQSVLIIQPLKVVCLAIFFAVLIKKVDEEDFQNMAFEGNDRNQGKSNSFTILFLVQRDGSLYEPPPPADIEKMKRNQIMDQKAFALIKEILIYMGYMWMLLLVAYGQRDPNAFFLNRHIRHSFSRGITDSMSLGEVFTWANTSLLENLYGVYPGFITDGNSKLVGNARLRQLRVQKNSCQTADSVVGIVRDCNAPYSWEVEEMGSYDPGWNYSIGDNISNSPLSPWKYQTQGQLRAYHFWGNIEFYRGGGFVAELGPDVQNASRYGLFRDKWLDIYTRAIFVEFTIYNANVNLFCIVTLLLETTAVGAFQLYSELQSVRLYQSTGPLHIFVMAAEIIYLVFILYYMFLQGKLMRQLKWAYFRSKWNIFELAIILLSWSALGVYIKRTLLGNRDMTYYQNHKDQFASFYETATADSVLQYLIALLVLLSTIKLWHLFRLNPKMNLISATLERAWGDISSFLMVIVIMFLAYSIASNVLYGWKLCHYRTLTDALLTIISLQIGIFNYDEVLNSSPWLGGLLFGSCVVFMSYIVLNLLISVILVAFNQEKIYHKPSDEEEIVDLMLKKICGLFGIRYKNATDTTGPDENGDMDLTLNNSRSTPYKSSADVKKFQTTNHPMNPLGS
uniref:Polycystic kidney disease 1 like 2a n=1 Tax=Labrus bergylta TaxID=56723 RepID=A0A3Q3GKD7_9LABR